MRIGHGFDVHAFGVGDALILSLFHLNTRLLPIRMVMF